MADGTTVEAVLVPPRRPLAGFGRRAWTRFARLAESTPALIGAGIVSFWIAVALLAPVIAPYPPNANDVAALADPRPSAAHWLGTDHLSRDILSRIFWGARTVLTVAPVAVLGAVALGSLLGLCGGYNRGWIDLVIGRACDIVLTFPVIILYLIVLTHFGSSALNVILVLALRQAPIIARIVRGITLELRDREYVAAAKMRGESALYIMLVEILPNARGPLIVDTCLRMGFNIVIIGVLGFLGIGLPPPDPDWGGMVRDTYGMMSVWPHMALFPSAAIASLVVGFNLLAVGLREIGLRD
ncbi:MAG TPA: ABC transporter permease [Methylomirabilota bacterium]|jgi:peptide/nickel transport system permease protein|nr:ABC transporter permease [Methylomirabilota bacterium]